MSHEPNQRDPHSRVGSVLGGEEMASETRWKVVSGQCWRSSEEELCAAVWITEGFAA